MTSADAYVGLNGAIQQFAPIMNEQFVVRINPNGKATQRLALQRTTFRPDNKITAYKVFFITNINGGNAYSSSASNWNNIYPSIYKIKEKMQSSVSLLN